MNHNDPDILIADSPETATAFGGVGLIAPTDGERLMRFRRHRDQAALTEVVEAHSGMVWGVCSQVLRHRQDIEDAFQATFLILARKARTIRAAESAAGWLYRVAFRTALLVRTQRAKRFEQPLVDEPRSLEDQFKSIEQSEQTLTLLEELNALPATYRQPIVLCYLEGKSRREAADQLGLTMQTVKGRLARGTRMLRTRMVRRGVALSTAMAVLAPQMAAQAASASMLAAQTAALGTGFAFKLTAAGASAATLKSAASWALAEKGLVAMSITAVAKPAVGVLAALVTAGTLTVAIADKPQGDGEAAAPIFALAGGEENGEQNSDDAVVEVDVAVTAADGESVETAANDGAAEPIAIAAAQPAAASAAVAPQTVEAALPVERAVAAAPAVPAVVAAPNIASGTFIAGGGGGQFGPVRAPMPPQQFGPFRLPSTPDVLGFATSTEMPNRVSREAMQLETEHWKLKAAGLEKKAKVIQMKARALRESGNAPELEILEAEAESELTMADVKLCEANARRLADALEALAQNPQGWPMGEGGNWTIDAAMAAQAAAAREAAMAAKAAAAREADMASKAAAKAKMLAKTHIELQGPNIKSPTWYGTPSEELKVGSKGNQVRALQETLNKRMKPSPRLDVDGDFGPLTEKAVMNFQNQNKLDADGIVGPLTWKLLGPLEGVLPPADVLKSQAAMLAQQRDQVANQLKALEKARDELEQHIKSIESAGDKR